MFITREQIKEISGYDVAQETLALAHLMIESWVGKSEADVEDAGDQALLARATLFQAVYITGGLEDILQQAALKRNTLAESTVEFVMDLFAPYMSPWAVITCKRLSWMGTRTVHTGPIFDRAPGYVPWERD